MLLDRLITLEQKVLAKHRSSFLLDNAQNIIVHFYRNWNCVYEIKGFSYLLNVKVGFLIRYIVVDIPQFNKNDGPNDELLSVPLVATQESNSSNSIKNNECIYGSR